MQKSNCDTYALDFPSGDGQYRLCWHASGGSLYGGFRSGTDIFLEETDTHERLVYSSGGVPVFRVVEHTPDGDIPYDFEWTNNQVSAYIVCEG